jgi:glycosyltransferase involved in cell wall biosynthesis
VIGHRQVHEKKIMKTAAFVIPVFNPPDDWQELLAEQLSLCHPTRALKIVAVDDGSSKTVDVERLSGLLPGAEVNLVRLERNMGKGAAVRYGLSVLPPADYYFYTDADFPYRPADVAAMMRVLDAGADVAPGMRDNTYFDHIPPMRKYISRILSKMIKLLVKIPFTDTQCGLKGFNENGRRLLLKTRVKRFLFDVEFIYLAYHTPGTKVVPVPVIMRSGINVSSVGAGGMLRELGNFLKILYRVYFRGW